MNDMGETSRLREEIEALRKRYAEMDAAYLHEAGARMDATARAEAAEARAARLEAALRNCRGYVLNVLARERAATLGCESSSTRECERDLAEIDALTDAARSAVSGVSE